MRKLFLVITSLALTASVTGCSKGTGDSAKSDATSAASETIVVVKIPITLPVEQSGQITFANMAAEHKSIPEAAWQRVQDVIASNQAVDIPTTISIGPTTGSTKEQILPLLQKEYRLWFGFTQPSAYLGLVYNGKDEPWAETEFAKLVAERNYKVNVADMTKRVMRDSCDFSNPTEPNCSGGNSLVFGDSTDGGSFYGVQEPYWSEAKQNVGPMSQVTHEYTHNVQFAQWIGVPLKSGENNRADSAHQVVPCWFQEGQANGIGITVWAPDLQTYIDGRKGNVARQINSNGPKPTLTDFSADKITSFLFDQDPLNCYQPGTNGDYQLGYSVGYAAAEALIAVGGPQSTMALLSRTASGDTWAEAFEAVYGISWQQGATYLGQALAAEYAILPLGSN